VQGLAPATESGVGALKNKKLILTSYRHEMSINFYRIMKGI
jgi:hypothetical protein